MSLLRCRQCRRPRWLGKRKRDSLSGSATFGCRRGGSRKDDCQMILFYLIACISSVLGVVLVIKAVVKVRMGQAFLLWLCYSAGEVTGTVLASDFFTLPG